MYHVMWYTVGAVFSRNVQQMLLWPAGMPPNDQLVLNYRYWGRNPFHKNVRVCIVFFENNSCVAG